MTIHKADLKLANWIDDLAKDVGKNGFPKEVHASAYSMFDELIKIAAPPEEGKGAKPEDIAKEEKKGDAPEEPKDEEADKDPKDEEPPAEEGDASKDAEDAGIPEDAPPEALPEVPTVGDVSKVVNDLKDLKKQVKELYTEKDLQSQLDVLKRRIEDIQIPDEANLNSTMFQSASKIGYVKREWRRFKAQLSKKSVLTGPQRSTIENYLNQHFEMSYPELAAFIAQRVNADKGEVFCYLMTLDRANYFGMRNKIN
jgi:hypothetical protein